MRGDIALAALPGDVGKPRPCVIVQGDLATDLPNIAVCALTGHIRTDRPAFRITIDPHPSNGLRLQSQVMVDRLYLVDRNKLRDRIGQLNDEQMADISTALSVLLGLT